MKTTRYRAELERLLDGFGTPKLRRVVFLCPRNWQIILAALYRAQFCVDINDRVAQK